jgi:hypothetical protein
MRTAKVYLDSVRNVLVSKVDDGTSYEASDPRVMADWLFSMGIRPGQVDMPDWRAGENAPTSGQKIALNARLHELNR